MPFPLQDQGGDPALPAVYSKAPTFQAPKPILCPSSGKRKFVYPTSSSSSSSFKSCCLGDECEGQGVKAEPDMHTNSFSCGQNATSLDDADSPPLEEDDFML